MDCLDELFLLNDRRWGWLVINESIGVEHFYHSFCNSAITFGYCDLFVLTIT